MTTDGVHAAHLALGSEWPIDPWTLLALTIGIVMYAFAVEVAWREGRRSILATSNVVAFTLGLLVIMVAIASPIASGSAESLSSHMFQHVLLVGAAAPLIAYGLPIARMPGLFGKRFVRFGNRHRRWLPSLVVAAVLSLVLHTLVVWGWHVPVVYQAMLDSTSFHAATHLAFLITGVMVWWCITGFGGPAGSGFIPIAAAAVLSFQGIVLGALMAFAAGPWYLRYAEAAVTAGFDPLADQQFAGMLMWGYGGIAALAAGSLAVVASIDRLNRYPSVAEPVEVVDGHRTRSRG